MSPSTSTSQSATTGQSASQSASAGPPANPARLIADADERGLAATALACLERCLPLLDPAVSGEALRPAWAGVARGGQGWAGRLDEARDDIPAATGTEDESAALVRRMLGAAPTEWAAAPLRVWADECSLIALDLHQRLCATETASPDELEGWRSGGADGMGPLAAGELRRQVQVLEIFADGAIGGLRRALDISAEGQRVVRAVVSRRARGA
ncbi:hypothetical protein [Streptomyces sp. NPDC047928]|uniref:hypothetical protein n=1 Tax=unclassified Streptomyces TaxID=2593676 RepID=UPI003718DEF9